jgi:hypothetical protein
MGWGGNQGKGSRSGNGSERAQRIWGLCRHRQCVCGLLILLVLFDGYRPDVRHLQISHGMDGRGEGEMKPSGGKSREYGGESRVGTIAHHHFDRRWKFKKRNPECYRQIADGCKSSEVNELRIDTSTADSVIGHGNMYERNPCGHGNMSGNVGVSCKVNKEGERPVSKFKHDKQWKYRRRASRDFRHRHVDEKFNDEIQYESEMRNSPLYPYVPFPLFYPYVPFPSFSKNHGCEEIRGEEEDREVRAGASQSALYPYIPFPLFYPYVPLPLVTYLSEGSEEIQGVGEDGQRGAGEGSRLSNKSTVDLQWQNSTEDTYGEDLQSRRKSRCRIGEAAHPGPGTKFRQQKLGDFFTRAQKKIDTKSEWCRQQGFDLVIIRGDGNCLYTCLGRNLEMTGDEVREAIMANAEIHWSEIFDWDNDGE